MVASSFWAVSPSPPLLSAPAPAPPPPLVPPPSPPATTYSATTCSPSQTKLPTLPALRPAAPTPYAWAGCFSRVVTCLSRCALRETRAAFLRTQRVALAIKASSPLRARSFRARSPCPFPARVALYWPGTTQLPPVIMALGSPPQPTTHTVSTCAAQTRSVDRGRTTPKLLPHMAPA